MKANELYEELFNASPDGVLLIDADTQRVLHFNDAACRQLGYTREEFLGLRISDYEASETADETAARVQHVLREGITEFDTRQRTKSGEIRHVHVWAKPFDLDGRRVLHAIIRDVTAFKQAEDTLRVSQADLAEAQRVAKVGSWKWVVHTDAITWSAELRRILGYDPDAREPGYDEHLRLYTAESAARLRAAVEQAMQTGAPVELELEQARTDGTRAWLVTRIDSARDATGQIVELHGTAQDITERKRVELVLRQSETRFRELSEHIQEVFWVANAHMSEVLYVSQAYETIWGRTCQSLYASPLDWLNAICPEDRDHMVRVMQTLATRGTYDEEYRILQLNGAERWIWDRAYAVRDEDGTVVRYVGVAEDITARKQAEESLRLQSAALHAAVDGILITDRAGVIDWVNPAFTRLTGYTADEALGKNPRELVKSHQHSPAFYKEMWDTILAGRTWRGDIINRRKDGRLYSERQAITPIVDASGTITHFVAIKKDITELLQLEAQYRQAQKMESVGQLASGIAHDFNNLLTVINGTSELVMARLAADSPLQADLQEIYRSGERAATMTRQLLAFSRQQLLEVRVVSLNTVVAGLADLLRRLLGEDINLVLVLTPDAARVKVDAGQIEQAITNLAVNARDAMPEGGSLTIETETVQVDDVSTPQHGETAAPGPYVRLTVTDSGVGMDETTRAHIFEPFFTTKAPGKGTGLGLATVYGIVKQSQGFIWVYSEVGQGTSFRIHLPQVTEAADAIPPTPTTVSRSGTETILLVEDNAALRHLATRILQPAGYTVLTAPTGDEALRLLDRHETPVHLLLSDVVMPGMNGRQLAERLAQTRPGMRVLYMSGYTSDTIVRHGVLEAQVPFLNKPFTSATLLRKVREVLDSVGPTPLDEPGGSGQ